MKAHTHYTTPIAARPWMRWSTRALAALLVLAAVSIALVPALRSFDHPAAPARPAAIGYCRVCQDEWIGAMQQSRVTFAPPPVGSTLRHAVPARVLPATYQHSATSRVFQDEMLGADQANLGSISLPGGVVLESQQDDPGKSGPR